MPPSGVPRVLAISARRRLFALGVSWRAWLSHLDREGVDALQLREKDLSDQALYELAQVTRRHYRGTLIINGRFDVALAVGADGLHLPSDGLPLAAINRHLGERTILLSRAAHDPAEVPGLLTAGADFVTLSPIWPTSSKPGHDALGTGAITACGSGAGRVLALGGVTPQNLAAARAAGAGGVAAIGALLEPQSIRAMARAACV